MSGSQRPGQYGNGPTILAVLALTGASFGLLFLSGMVLPHLFGLAVVVAGFVSFIAFHYLVWGWWMSGGDDEDPQ